MCVIAGYAGDRPAAPILLEMLRRQECYDGDMSTGVATIHEGRLYYRRCVGNVDTVIPRNHTEISYCSKQRIGKRAIS